MKRCPACGAQRPYKLADGRLKCRHCDRRFSWTSVWDSVRLAPNVKGRLLDLFVLGVPSYRQRFRAGTSAPTRERFYRLARACCVASARPRDPATWIGVHRNKRGAETGTKAAGFGIINRGGTLRVVWVTAQGGARIAPETVHAGHGSMYHSTRWQVHARLPLRGGHAVIYREAWGPIEPARGEGIDAFWSYAKTWLAPYHGIPRRYAHLYLGEVCYRFNRRDVDLKPPLYRLMKRHSVLEINVILGRKS